MEFGYEGRFKERLLARVAVARGTCPPVRRTIEDALSLAIVARSATATRWAVIGLYADEKTEKTCRHVPSC